MAPRHVVAASHLAVVVEDGRAALVAARPRQNPALEQLQQHVLRELSVCLFVERAVGHVGQAIAAPFTPTGGSRGRKATVASNAGLSLSSRGLLHRWRLLTRAILILDRRRLLGSTPQVS